MAAIVRHHLHRRSILLPQSDAPFVICRRDFETSSLYSRAAEKGGLLGNWASGSGLWLGGRIWLPLTCAFLDLIYALTSNPKIAVLSVPLGATTLEGTYTAQIIEVSDNRHEFVEPLPVTYVHTQAERNVHFTDVCRWTTLSQIVDRFQESAALLSYLVEFLAHLYPPNSLRQRTL
jgi:hypothetical protein